MRRLPFILLALTALPAPPAVAWSQAAHEVVAAVAYRELPAPTRQRLDSLLRRHPDYPRLARDLSPGDPDLGLRVFMRAARWPDDIRDDPRFADRAEDAPAEVLPGLPDMLRHRGWHYVDQTFSTDGTPAHRGTGPDAGTQALALEAVLRDSAASAERRAWALSWLAHLVAELHQPLHATSRASRRHPGGDRGGNDFPLRGRDPNLHRFWDGALTPELPAPRLVALADELRREWRPEPATVAGPQRPAAAVEVWIAESATLARHVVYTVGEEGPPAPRVPRSYRRLARRIARQRAAAAGHHLAALLTGWLP
jgi:hypothetical protein